MINALLADKISCLVKKGLYRKPGCCDDFAYNFSSNDYLSLGYEHDFRQAFIEGLQKYPPGSGGSLYVSGYKDIHQQLETAFCQLLDCDAALLFPSGYSANLAIAAVTAFTGLKPIVDKSIHASFYDGFKLANINFTRFHHNNCEHLQEKLLQFPQGIVFTEGIFSMSGAIPPLDKIGALAKNNAVIVDESHSFGVFGKKGLGSVSYFGLEQAQVPLRVISFGKALCSQGAIVVGQKLWIEALYQTGAANRYSTALSPATAYGILANLPRIIGADERRAGLAENIRYFRSQINQSRFIWRSSESPIQQLQLGCPNKAIMLASFLTKRGIQCLAVRQPTVNYKETGLRLVLNYRHTRADIAQFFSTLEEAYDSLYQDNR